MAKVKRKDGLKRQAQIMNIALLLFADKGYHATSIDDILKEAGIAKGTFYLHFKSKIDLLEFIIDSRFEVFYKSVEVLDISVFSSIEEMKSLYVNVAEFLTGSEELRVFMKLVLKEYTGLELKIFNKINSFVERLVLMSTENIKKAQKEGKANPDIDPYISSFSIVAATKEMIFKWAVLDEDFDVKITVSSMVDVFMNGLIKH